MSFQIHALAVDQFTPLFALPDSELANIRATRMVADAKPGNPCVSAWLMLRLVKSSCWSILNTRPATHLFGPRMQS